MAIVIELPPDAQEKLNLQAAEQGEQPEVHAARLLEQALANAPRKYDIEKTRAAVARWREVRKGITLGGLTIRELVDEGRP